MWPGMKILPAAAYLSVTSLLLACASPVAEPQLPAFGKSLASEMDALDSQGLDIVHADDAGKLSVHDAEHTKERALESSLSHAGFELTAAARGLAADGGALRWEWLATVSHDPRSGLGVLSIHDTDGRLAHEEVLLEECSSLAWRGGDVPELLVGCIDHVWRYQPGAGSEPILTRAQFQGSGGAFGPLSFGDSAPRVRTALQLAGGACKDESCMAWAIHLDERDFTLVPEYQQGTLSRVTVFGPRRPRSEWRTKVRADWRTLVSEITREAPAEDAEYPSTTSLSEIPETDGISFAPTHQPVHDGTKAMIGLFENETGNVKGFGAIAVISPAPAASVPASAAP
jgi:hypothetical protein